MQTLSIKADGKLVTSLKAAADKVRVAFPQFVRECLFLSLIHLDLSYPGIVKFKTKSAAADKLMVHR